MRVNGADSVTTAVLIGNTPEVNENFYTYDVSESDYKKELIRKVSLCGQTLYHALITLACLLPAYLKKPRDKTLIKSRNFYGAG